MYCLEPENLASYDIEKLRVAKGDVIPKRADSVLPSTEAAYIHRHHTFIERSAREVSELEAGGELPVPYWDPSLAGDRSKRHQFLRLLLRLRIVGAHLQVKQVVGVFFVKKKDGNIRMVVDCRRTNR